MGETSVQTPATVAIAAAGIPFRVVQIERPSSVEESAERQGIEVGQVVRTIVVRRGDDDYLFILVPGGLQIDWPKLRTHLGVSRMSLPDQDEARDATGYERGAITPFGATTAWPTIADASLLELGTVAIGGGAHGVNIHLDAADLITATGAVVTDVTRSKG